MSIFGISTISALIVALKEFLRWRAVKAEIEAKRLIIDEMEKIEDETKEFEKTINDLRYAGKHDTADLLLNRAVRRARLSVRISELGKGADVQSTTQDDSGGRFCNQETTGSDIGSDRSDTEASVQGGS